MKQTEDIYTEALSLLHFTNFVGWSCPEFEKLDLSLAGQDVRLDPAAGGLPYHLQAYRHGFLQRHLQYAWKCDYVFSFSSQCAMPSVLPITQTKEFLREEALMEDTFAAWSGKVCA